jgi:Flp pilus assembly protein TadG
MQPARRERDVGNAALELVILAPVVLLLISFVIAAGRTSIAQGSVQAAARDAARQASIARTLGAAIAAAQASAQAELAQEGLDCSPAPLVRVRAATAFAPGKIGQPATVSATVICHVPLSDLLLPGVPGSKILTANFTSPLDPYRGR